MALPPPPPPSPPELNDDVISEILLRLPPDEPEWLFRAALVCKPWLRTLSDPGFLRLYREFHGVPPLLGLVDWDHKTGQDLRILPTTALPGFALPVPYPGFYCGQPLDCRHGRVITRVIEDSGSSYYLVLDTVTGDLHPVARTQIQWTSAFFNAVAVFCDAAACDHLGCHGGPFRVVVMAKGWRPGFILSTVYSSEMGAWSTPAATLEGVRGRGTYGRVALIRDEVYFMSSRDSDIIKYDWRKNCLSLVDPPPSAMWYSTVALMVMEDTSLGLAGTEDSSLYLWSRKVTSEGTATWVQCRVIDLDTVMPMANPTLGALVVGFAEGVHAIFIYTRVGLFMMELKSGRVRKVKHPEVRLGIILPYMSFYTPDRCRLPSQGGPADL